jgi:hypothetical protein
MSGPATNATPKTAPNRPWYLPRSAGLKRSPMIASAIGNSAPAPMPWRPRNRISCSMFCDRPDRAEPIRKMTMPMMNIGLRP